MAYAKNGARRARNRSKRFAFRPTVAERAARCFLIPLFFVVAACSLLPEGEQEAAVLTPVAFSDLPGWAQDSPSEALTAFSRSCVPLRSKKVWKDVCARAGEVAKTHEAARAFFEKEFVPHAVSGAAGEYGLFTGYYLPELRGALRRGGAFQTPIYERPKDLVTVDLGVFKQSLKGQRIVGKVQDGKLIPYDDRTAIAAGSLEGRAKPLLWTDDPAEAFFMEVQGSGIVRLKDGKKIPVGYAQANGHAYTSIGRALADRGDLARPVTLYDIYDWLSENPEKAQQTMNVNASYIFFRLLPEGKVVGAQGVELTPERSLAVDRRHIPLGAPVFLDAVDGYGEPLRRLMVAQDVGGAIKGVVRGDFYWGAGEEAEDQAGSMQGQGRFFVLLPKTGTSP